MTTFAEKLKLLMSERGITLRQLARETTYSPGHLSKVMNGHRAPTSRLAARLDGALGAKGTLIAATAAPALPDTSELHELELLRQELGDALCEGAMVEAGLDDWEQAVLSLGRATRDRPAGRLFSDLVVDLVELKRALRRCRTASSLRRLTQMTAQMSGLMYLTLVKLDWRTMSCRWARTARIAAKEAGDPVTQSWVLAHEAYGQYYSGRYSDAIAIARNAQSVAGRHVCVSIPLAAALEARAYAALGARDEVGKALKRAEDSVSRLRAAALVPSAFGYNEAQLRFHEGNAYTRLAQAEGGGRGDLKRALHAQERALELCAEGDYTDWALIRLDLASCLARDRDLATAMTYMAETLTSLTQQQRQGLVTLRGHEIVRALPQRQQALPMVRDLRDLLMETTERTEVVDLRGRRKPS